MIIEGSRADALALIEVLLPSLGAATPLMGAFKSHDFF